jgi:hypothetical protein
LTQWRRKQPIEHDRARLQSVIAQLSQGTILMLTALSVDKLKRQ